jgi:hypothetical protein
MTTVELMSIRVESVLGAADTEGRGIRPVYCRRCGYQVVCSRVRTYERVVTVLFPRLSPVRCLKCGRRQWRRCP